MQYKDLLQLMIDGTIGSGHSNRKLTTAEVASHAIAFIMAGYETTSGTLSYVAYLLALNPDIQERLQEEIDQFYEEHPVNYI